MAKHRRTSIRWDGDRIAVDVDGASVRGVEVACEWLLGEARQQVPIDEGTLERSGTVTISKRDKVGAVSFDTLYAVRQHEDLENRHAGGRKAKYLEDPARDGAQTIRDLIAAELRRVMR